MRREYQERFPRHRLQRKSLVSDPGMHHGTCVTHVPWCISGSLTRDCRGNVPGIPGACRTRNLRIWQEAKNCGMRMRREYQERFPRHRLQRKSLVSDPGMHHGTCVTHVPWCISGSLTRDCRGNVPGIPGACRTRNLRIWQEASQVSTRVHRVLWEVM